MTSEATWVILVDKARFWSERRDEPNRLRGRGGHLSPASIRLIAAAPLAVWSRAVNTKMRIILRTFCSIYRTT